MTVVFIIMLFVKKIFLMPKACWWYGKDFYTYLDKRLWLDFCGWGLHLYVGRFGSGKTSSMVHDAYLLCKRYPQLTVCTNLKLINFPPHTKIIPCRTPQDILDAPKNTLVLIDEIGTIFNSRDFSTSKESVPKILFQHICQCRKRKLMIYSTTQRWNFMDKQLRDITATVRQCSMSFSYRFNRLATVKYYDSVDYDLAFSNPLLPLPMLNATAYIQTDFYRDLYDTEELIQNMLKADYISDAEILANQQGGNVLDINNDEGIKRYKRSRKKLV